MKIINSSYEILPFYGGGNGMDVLRFIEDAGRTCYKSEHINKERDAEKTKKFVKRLIDSHHESVLEHIGFSVKFICSRSTTHQLVRHRICSYSQESQRFCKYNNHVTFIRPLWIPEDVIGEFDCDDIPKKIWDFDGEEITDKQSLWFVTMTHIERIYNDLLAEGCSAQEAREVLPNSTKTEIVASTNLRQWRHILKERTDEHADPEIRRLMRPLLDELKIVFPIIFDDINY